jgi:hypothetical protein
MGPKNVAKSTIEAYDPQGSGIGSVSKTFSRYAPGVAESGNMKFKWSVPGNHSNSSEPPSQERSE